VAGRQRKQRIIYVRDRLRPVRERSESETQRSYLSEVVAKLDKHRLKQLTMSNKQ